MKKILVVVDMQNDFIDPVLGSLGTQEACEAVHGVVEVINKEPYERVYATMDTHYDHYLDTQEGKYLPVKHCIKGTYGWDLNSKVEAALKGVGYTKVEKNTFGSIDLALEIDAITRNEDIHDFEVVMCGVCTDICVISNALLLKAWKPELKITVVEKACAGVTPLKHEEAIDVMKSCQIEII